MEIQTEELFSAICFNCGGECCRNLYVWYNRSGKAIYRQRRERLAEETSMELKVMNKRPMWFTCKTLDKETGKCKDYENRPRMCKSFICEGGIISMLESINA